MPNLGGMTVCHAYDVMNTKSGQSHAPKFNLVFLGIGGSLSDLFRLHRDNWTVSTIDINVPGHALSYDPTSKN